MGKHASTGRDEREMDASSSPLAENCQFHAHAALSRKDVVSCKDFSSLELFRLFSKTKAMI